MSDGKVKIGIIGCGSVSGSYLRTAQVMRMLETSACADLDPLRAKAKAEEFGIPRTCSVDELLADPEIDIAVNLTSANTSRRSDWLTPGLTLIIFLSASDIHFVFSASAFDSIWGICLQSLGRRAGLVNCRSRSKYSENGDSSPSHV